MWRTHDGKGYPPAFFRFRGVTRPDGLRSEEWGFLCLHDTWLSARWISALTVYRRSEGVFSPMRSMNPCRPENRERSPITSMHNGSKRGTTAGGDPAGVVQGRREAPRSGRELILPVPATATATQYRLGGAMGRSPYIYLTYRSN